MTASSKRSKLILKIVGLTLLIAGLALVIVGLVDFFGSIGKMRGLPEYFWCLFVGFPVSAIGGFLTLMGFRREIMSSVMEDTLPVIREVTNAVQDRPTVRCACGTDNDADSKFCKSCGKALSEKE